MPHVSSSGGDDLASSDEVKVYKDEGEEENQTSENLAEDKVVLVTETEEVLENFKVSLICLFKFQGLVMDNRPSHLDIL